MALATESLASVLVCRRCETVFRDAGAFTKHYCHTLPTRTNVAGTFHVCSHEGPAPFYWVTGQEQADVKDYIKYLLEEGGAEQCRNVEILWKGFGRQGTYEGACVGMKRKPEIVLVAHPQPVPAASGPAEWPALATGVPQCSFQPRQLPSQGLRPAPAAQSGEAGVNPGSSAQLPDGAASKLLQQQSKAAQQRAGLHQKLKALQEEQQHYTTAAQQEAAAAQHRTKRRQVLAPDTPELMALAVQPALHPVPLQLAASPFMCQALVPGMVHITGGFVQTPAGLMQAPGALLVATMQQLQGAQLSQFMGGLAMTAPREAAAPSPATAILHGFPGLAMLQGAPGPVPFLMAPSVPQPQQQLFPLFVARPGGSTSAGAHVAMLDPGQQRHAKHKACTQPPSASRLGGTFKGIPVIRETPGLQEWTAARGGPPGQPASLASSAGKQPGAATPGQGGLREPFQRRLEPSAAAALPSSIRAKAASPPAEISTAAPSPATACPASCPPAASPPTPARTIRPAALHSRIVDMGLSWDELAEPVDSRAAEAAARSGGPLSGFEFVVRSGEEMMAEARCEEAPAMRRALEAHEPLSLAILAGVVRLAQRKVEPSDGDLTELLKTLGLTGERLQGLAEDGLHKAPCPPCALMLRSMVGLAVSAMEGGLLLPEPRLDALQTQLVRLRRRAWRVGQRQRQQEQRASSGNSGGCNSDSDSSFSSSSDDGRGDEEVQEDSSSDGELDCSAASLQQRLAALEAAVVRLSTSRSALSGKVSANFAALRERMADTPHAELRSAAGSQAEVVAQLRESGALEGRDWVQIVPSAGSSGPGYDAMQAAKLVAGTGGRWLPLRQGRMIVGGNDGQQVVDAQPTDVRRALAVGKAHLLLLQRIMAEHAQLLGSEDESPWSPDNPAHQALYWLALGMVLTRRQAAAERVGYYHSEVQLQARESGRFLGGVLHPSLAPPAAPGRCGCTIHKRGYDVALTVVEGERQGGFSPGTWPWQNSTAWCLTDMLSGPLLRAMTDGVGDVQQLPILPGINSGFCIITAAASLAIHVEDFCGGSTNQCWAGFKLWMFVPPAVLESRRYLPAKLLGKQVPPEWLLADKELLPHVQLALQLPGQLMLLKPGMAYHGVAVAGYCIAEAGNHWQVLEPGPHNDGVEDWLGKWAGLKAHSSAAWLNRMRPLWFFFEQLHEILEGCVQRLHELSEEGSAVARAVGRLLKLRGSSGGTRS